MTNAAPGALFDAHADSYARDLAAGLSLSGESQAYFAAGRVAWMGKCLVRLGAPRGALLDYGCGTGGTASLLLSLPGAERVAGVDLSAESIRRAGEEAGGERISFHTMDSFAPREEFDAAYTNGVFHHIPPPERPAALAYIFRSLKPGGYLALYENNPWNPGTRIVMKRIPFDREARMLTPAGTRRLARGAGFSIVRTDYLFFFPSFLRILRFLEPRLRRAPLGAQYLVLARKPESK